MRFHVFCFRVGSSTFQNKAIIRGNK
jgi:hypothetical protein